jgi:hypothetical protein
VPDVLLPPSGQTVVILDEDGHEHRSVVEAVTDEQRMELRRPAGLAIGVPLLIGDVMTLTWTAGENTVGMVRARLVAMRRHDELAVWDVELIGEPWKIERRAHVRVNVDGTIRVSQVVDQDAPTAGRSAEGSLVDISEAAVRCALDAREIWASRRNSHVLVVFELGGHAFELPGRVVAGEIARRNSGLRDVVVSFDQPAEGLEPLRDYLSHAEH